MKVGAQQKKHKKRYSRISTEKRLRLIKLVLEEGLNLTKVSKLLHIKRPTAKVILKRFKEDGTFFRKKSADVKTKDTIPSNNEIKVEENIKQAESIEINQYPSIENLDNRGESQIQDKYHNGTQPVNFVLLFSGVRQYHPFI